MKIRVGDLLNGKYEVERHLATGGMGSIWVARDLKLCRRVAVKFIEFAPTDDTDATTIHARFEREALAVARLNTPHVVQVYDHALDSDKPYIVMEYLEGEGLNGLFAREGRLSFPATVSIMNQAARGLRAAHEAGIVHRDLKPANIFLAQVDHEQVVKILDFGIAKLLDHRSVTVDGEIFGSARYMSPEQIFGAKDLDLRSDLWSMGVILYRAITGCDAFSRDIVETVQSLRLGKYQPATSVLRHLLPEVDTFFERALALDKNRRFLSAVEMAEAFAEVAEQHATTTTMRRRPVAPVLQAAEPPKTARVQAVPPAEPAGEPPKTTRIEAVAPTDFDAPTPLMAHKVVADPPPHEEETLSATARETRPAHQKRRSRARLGALAAIGLAAAAFALWPRSAPAVSDVRSPPPAESGGLLSPVPAAPPADPEAAEGVAPASSADPEAAPSPSGAEAPPSAGEADPTPPAPAGAPPSARAAPARGSATPRPAARPSCNPPYSVDALGVRHPIKACL